MGKANATEQFQQLQEAYQLLNDPSHRAALNQRLNQFKSFEQVRKGPGDCGGMGSYRRQYRPSSSRMPFQDEFYSNYKSYSYPFEKGPGARKEKAQFSNGFLVFFALMVITEFGLLLPWMSHHRMKTKEAMNDQVFSSEELRIMEQRFKTVHGPISSPDKTNPGD